MWMKSSITIAASSVCKHEILTDRLNKIHLRTVWCSINFYFCSKQTRKACKSLAFGSWFSSFSRVLPTSQVGYHAGKPIESVVHCLNKRTRIQPLSVWNWTIRSFSSYDGEFVLLQTSSFLLQSVLLVIFWRVLLDWNCKRLYLSSEKEK